MATAAGLVRAPPFAAAAQLLGANWVTDPSPSPSAVTTAAPGPAAAGKKGSGTLIPAVAAGVVAAIVGVLAVALFVNRRRRKAPLPAARERFVWVRALLRSPLQPGSSAAAWL